MIDPVYFFVQITNLDLAAHHSLLKYALDDLLSFPNLYQDLFGFIVTVFCIGPTPYRKRGQVMTYAYIPFAIVYVHLFF